MRLTETASLDCLVSPETSFVGVIGRVLVRIPRLNEEEVIRVIPKRQLSCIHTAASALDVNEDVGEYHILLRRTLSLLQPVV